MQNNENDKQKYKNKSKSKNGKMVLEWKEGREKTKRKGIVIGHSKQKK